MLPKQVTKQHECPPTNQQENKRFFPRTKKFLLMASSAIWRKVGISACGAKTITDAFDFKRENKSDVVRLVAVLLATYPLVVVIGY